MFASHKGKGRLTGLMIAVLSVAASGCYDARPAQAGMAPPKAASGGAALSRRKRGKWKFRYIPRDPFASIGVRKDPPGFNGDVGRIVSSNSQEPDPGPWVVPAQGAMSSWWLVGITL